MENEIKERLKEIIEDWMKSFSPSSEIITEDVVMDLYNAGICFMDSWQRYKFKILPLIVGKTVEEFISIVNRLEVRVQQGGFCYIFLREDVIR